MNHYNVVEQCRERCHTFIVLRRSNHPTPLFLPLNKRYSWNGCSNSASSSFLNTGRSNGDGAAAAASACTRNSRQHNEARWLLCEWMLIDNHTHTHTHHHTPSHTCDNDDPTCAPAPAPRTVSSTFSSISEPTSGTSFFCGTITFRMNDGKSKQE